MEYTVNLVTLHRELAERCEMPRPRVRTGTGALKWLCHRRPLSLCSAGTTHPLCPALSAAGRCGNEDGAHSSERHVPAAPALLILRHPHLGRASGAGAPAGSAPRIRGSRDTKVPLPRDRTTVRPEQTRRRRHFSISSSPVSIHRWQTGTS